MGKVLARLVDVIGAVLELLVALVTLVMSSVYVVVLAVGMGIGCGALAVCVFVLWSFINFIF